MEVFVDFSVTVEVNWIDEGIVNSSSFWLMPELLPGGGIDEH